LTEGMELLVLRESPPQLSASRRHLSR